jgi:hypothetical protein
MGAQVVVRSPTVRGSIQARSSQSSRPSFLWSKGPHRLDHALLRGHSRALLSACQRCGVGGTRRTSTPGGPSDTQDKLCGNPSRCSYLQRFVRCPNSSVDHGRPRPVFFYLLHPRLLDHCRHFQWCSNLCCQCRAARLRLCASPQHHSRWNDDVPKWAPQRRPLARILL